MSKRFFKGAHIVLPLLLVLFIFSCSKKEEKVFTSLEEQGRTVYMTNCVSCHNSDANLPGVLGPELAGSSEELIKTKLLSKTYPAGYVPKRQTQLMPTLPFLEKDIPALHAYLASFLRK